MFKKKLLTALVAATLLASVTAMSAEFVIKIGHLANTDHSWHKGCLKFEELVEKESGGRVDVIVYPNNEIGSEMEVIDSIHGGLAQMVISADSLANWVPDVAILSIPYMIRDLDHMQKILDSDIGKGLNEQIIKKASLRPLSAFARAPRNLTSNKPITTPADAKGLNLRVPNVPLHVAAWQAAGLKPIPMAFSEVFTSLQQGVIDTQENPPDLIKSASFYEVQKYMNKTEHVRTWIYLLIGEDYFQGLPKDLQDIVVKAGKDAEKYERQVHLADLAAVEKFLQDKGMIFHPADKGAFAKAMQPAVMEFLKNLDKSKGTKILEQYEKVVKM